MPIFCDTHAHLYLEQFDEDRSQMLQRAWDKGIKYIFLPNIDVQSLSSLYDLVALAPQQCFPMIGLHPCSVKADFEHELEQIDSELSQKSEHFYAIGEIGLDFYWDLTHRTQQFEALEQQITWAKKYNLPVVLHCRNSHAEVYEVIKKHNDTGFSGIFHCFSGNADDAQTIVAELPNFYIGIGGVITYKKGGLEAVVEASPLNRIVLETDAPYLSPEPYRSAKNKAERRNESAYIIEIAQKIANIKGTSIEEVAQITTQNALRLFKWQEKQKNKPIIALQS